MRCVEEALVTIIENIERSVQTVEEMSAFIEDSVAQYEVARDVEKAGDLLCAARGSLQRSLVRVREAQAEAEIAAERNRDVQRSIALGAEIGRQAEQRAAAAKPPPAPDAAANGKAAPQRIVPRVVGSPALPGA
jgi:hypothetical protein